MRKLNFILLILLILATCLIVGLKPALHKTVKIENANFAIEDKSAASMTKEEKIVWNSWRSALGNKILKEKNVPQDEALNVANFIEFNVDNKRNVFNIKITTDPPQYTKIAQKYYMDYLNDLNGNPILEFPKGSKRKVVFVKIPILTSTTEKLSKPEDFSDNETIAR